MGGGGGFSVAVLQAPSPQWQHAETTRARCIQKWKGNACVHALCAPRTQIQQIQNIPVRASAQSLLPKKVCTLVYVRREKCEHFVEQYVKHITWIQWGLQRHHRIPTKHICLVHGAPACTRLLTAGAYITCTRNASFGQHINVSQLYFTTLSWTKPNFSSYQTPRWCTDVHHRFDVLYKFKFFFPVLYSQP